MAEYLVTYKLHLIEALKPPDWPNPVLNVASYNNVNNIQELRAEVDKQIITFGRQGGFVFLKDTNKVLQDDVETMDLRIFVPLTLATHLTTTTTRMVDEPEDIFS